MNYRVFEDKMYEFINSDINKYVNMYEYFYENEEGHFAILVPKSEQKNMNKLYEQSFELSIDDEGLYKLKVIEFGFETIDPVLKEEASIGVSLDEIQDKIKDLISGQNTELRTNILRDAELEDISDSTFLGSCTQKTLTNFQKGYRGEEIYDEVDMNFLFFEKEDKILMVKSFTEGEDKTITEDHGLVDYEEYVGEAYFSYGIVEAYEVKQVPKVFEYVPSNKENHVEVINASNQYNHAPLSINIDGETILSKTIDENHMLYQISGVVFDKDSPVIEENPEYSKEIEEAEYNGFEL